MVGPPTVDREPRVVFPLGLFIDFLFFCRYIYTRESIISMRARRIGDYVMTEAKQARMQELAQQERERELATLLAQQQLFQEQKLESDPTHVDRPRSSESEEK